MGEGFGWGGVRRLVGGDESAVSKQEEGLAWMYATRCCYCCII